MTPGEWMFVFAALGFLDGCLVTWTLMRDRTKPITVETLLRIRGEEIARYVTAHQQRRHRRNPVRRPW